MQLYRPDNPYRRPPAVRCRREVCDYLNKPKLNPLPHTGEGDRRMVADSGATVAYYPVSFLNPRPRAYPFPFFPFKPKRKRELEQAATRRASRLCLCTPDSPLSRRHQQALAACAPCAPPCPHGRLKPAHACPSAPVCCCWRIPCSQPAGAGSKKAKKATDQ